MVKCHSVLAHVNINMKGGGMEGVHPPSSCFPWLGPKTKVKVCSRSRQLNGTFQGLKQGGIGSHLGA